MITFKLNNKKYNLETSWDELSFKKYAQIMKLGGDTYKILSLFTGVPEKDFKDPKARITGLEAMLEALAFLRTVPKVPEKVVQIGKYKLPINNNGTFNPQFESLAQFEDMWQIIKTTPDNDIIALTNSYPSIIAPYLQKIRDGVYDPEQAKAMIPEVEEMNGLEVIALGSFFLIKLLSLKLGTAAIFPNTKKIQTKKTQASKTYTKSSGKSYQQSRSRKKSGKA